MPINISSKLKNEIVDTYMRTNIESMLVTKSAGKCFLCNQPINSTTEEIEADHDLPRSLGGKLISTTSISYMQVVISLKKIMTH